MGLEEIGDQGPLAGVTPAVRTPALPVQTQVVNQDLVDAIECVQQEDRTSAKEEIENEEAVINSVGELNLLDPSLVNCGLIEIYSSSGIDSESSSSESDAISEGRVGPQPLFSRTCPTWCESFQSCQESVNTLCF